jgi:hypothetical protein
MLGVAGKLGRIDILNVATSQSHNLLTIPADLNTLFDETPGLNFDAFESGVAGLTFHPDFNNPANPNGFRKFYVNASFDNSVVPDSPFIYYTNPQTQQIELINPAAITTAQLNQINADARIPLNPPFNPANPNGVLRECFICDHPEMQMEMRLTNGTSGAFDGVECFIDNGQGFTTGHKPAQALNPMYTEVREYMVNDNGSPNNPAAWTVDSNEFKTVLRFLLPRDFHHAGDMHFGHDGMLYITTGDTKGHPTEIHTYPEDPNTRVDGTIDFSGKVLRIDVSNVGDLTPAELESPLIRNYDVPPDNPFDNEVYAYGFRNPWRGSIDRVTGDLWVGDVGFTIEEEVNLVTRGFNGGWPFWEGETESDLHPTFEGSDPDGPGGPLPPHGTAPPLQDVAPTYSYSHPKRNNRSTTTDNPTLSDPDSFEPDRFLHDPNYFDPFYSRGAAVMGGVVYRGPDPTLQGKYIFYESGQRQILMLDPNLSPSDPNYVQDISDQFFTYLPTTLSDSDDVNGDSVPEVFSYPGLIPRVPADGAAVGLMVAFGEDDAGNVYLVNHFDSRIYRLTTSNPDPDDPNLVGMPGTRGDLNSDGLVNTKDIHLLAVSVRPGAKPPLPVYDLNENGGVTYVRSSAGMIISDSDRLVRELVEIRDSMGNVIGHGTDYGDTDIDDDIDTVDITRTISNFTGAGNTGKRWETGDFDGDSDTDTVDITTVISNFTGAGGGAGAATAAGHATDHIFPTLVYDSRTGEVVVNPGDETILSFSLAAGGLFSASADFGELDASVLAGLSSSVVDNTSDQVGWVSVAATAGLGLDSAETIGTILPGGLSSGQLSVLLGHSWAGPRGAGGSFELIVIPEPGGALLAVLAIFCMFLSQRRPQQIRTLDEVFAKSAN